MDLSEYRVDLTEVVDLSANPTVAFVNAGPCDIVRIGVQLVVGETTGGTGTFAITGVANSGEGATAVRSPMKVLDVAVASAGAVLWAGRDDAYNARAPHGKKAPTTPGTGLGPFVPNTARVNAGEAVSIVFAGCDSTNATVFIEYRDLPFHADSDANVTNVSP